MGAPTLQSGRPSHGQKFEVYEEEEEPELWMAAAQGDVARVQRLVESEADVAWADTFGSTALHCACTNGHAVCARLLITARASVDQTNKNGATALHVACWNSSGICPERSGQPLECTANNFYDDATNDPGACAALIASGTLTCADDFDHGGQYQG